MNSPDRPTLTIVSSYLPPHVGGVETMAFEQARRLARRGWNVEILASRLGRDGAVELHDGVIVRRIRSINPLERRFHVPVPLMWPSLGRRLVRPERRPDVVLVHGHVYISSVYAALTAHRAGIPMVVLQSNPYVDYPAPIDTIERVVNRVIGRRVLDAAQLVVAISEYTAEYVTSISPTVHPVVVLCGVDTDRFAPVRQTGTGKAATSTTSTTSTGRTGIGPRRAVTVRRLVDRNGVDVLIDAWRLSGLDDTAELVIGGTGPERASLAARADGLHNVRFLGFVPDDDLADCYRNATVAVMPTRSGEGFGLMAAEALACGTPVIASRQGALPEVVRDGVDGLLVTPDDPAELAAALRRVFDDPALAERLRAATADTDFSWDHNIDQLDPLLRSLIRPVG